MTSTTAPPGQPNCRWAPRPTRTSWSRAARSVAYFCLNADNLGGREQGPGGSDENLYQSQPYGGLWGHPAVFEASTSLIPAGSSGLSDYVYSVGKNDYVRALRIDTNSSGVPQLTDVANSTFQFGYGSGSPVVTSNGNDPSSAVVWVVDKSGSSSSLIAFPVVPQPAKGGGVKLQEIDGEPIGTASNFTIPATSNGMVYVGTLDGHVLGFGVTTGAALHRNGPEDFGNTAVGSVTTRTATVTASRTVTVTGISSSAVTSPEPFTIGQVTETSPSGTPVPVTFPVTLHSGDALHAPVTFAPAAPGGTNGAVSFATTAGQNVPVSVPLIADATQTGLYATATSLSMLLSLNDGTQVGPVPVGLPEYAVSTIVNGGTTPQRITKISGPGGPFSARFAAPGGHRPAAWPVRHRAVRLHAQPGVLLQLGAHHHRQQRHASEGQPVRRERAGRQQVQRSPERQLR